MLTLVIHMRIGRQQKLLDAVNVNVLTESETMKWTAYRSQVHRGECLDNGQQAEVVSWIARGP